MTFGINQRVDKARSGFEIAFADAEAHYNLHGSTSNNERGERRPTHNQDLNTT